MLKRGLLVIVATGAACLFVSEQPANACSNVCQPQSLPYAGKTLPTGITAIPLVSPTPATATVTKDGQPVDVTVKGEGDVDLVFASPLVAGTYDVSYAQYCGASQATTESFTVQGSAPLPTTTGTLTVATKFVPKGTVDAAPSGCGGVDENSYDRVEATLTLTAAKEIAPYATITRFTQSLTSPGATTPAASQLVAGSVPTPYTFTQSVRCDSERTSGDSQPGHYKVSFAAQISGGTSLAPADVEFDLVCPDGTDGTDGGTEAGALGYTPAGSSGGCSVSGGGAGARDAGATDAGALSGIAGALGLVLAGARRKLRARGVTSLR